MLNKETLIYLNNYVYSSYLDYIDTHRVQNKILDKSAFPGYFPNKESFSKEIFDWLQYDPSC